MVRQEHLRGTMSTTTTNPVGTSTNSTTFTDTNTNNAYGTSNPNGGTLTVNDFMNLLVTQLKNQDPTDPISDQDFAAQMAQFTSLQETSNMNTTLTNYSQLSELGTGAGLIGATVTSTQDDSSGNPTTTSGTVTAVGMTNNTVYLTVNGTQVPLSSITSVTPTTASSASTTGS
jgi:flagellar basal-body rod modification protein FlgD